MLAPKATFAVAAPKPLNGIFALSNLASVTFAFLIFAVSTALFAISETTIVPSTIFAVVTASSANLASVTLAFVILAVVTTSVANIAFTTLLVPIAVTPAFVIVTSPVGVTSVATLDAFPK